jgi:hypothetical protein
MSSPTVAQSHDKSSLFPDITKMAVAGGGVIAYVFGLLTTNYYLYRIGESDFGNFHVKFVYTGAYVMVLPLMFWLALLAFRSTRRHGPWLVGPAVSISAVALALYYPAHNNGANATALNGSLYLIVGSMLMAVALFFGLDLLVNTRAKYKVAKAIVIAAVFLLASPNYIQAYADHMYPYEGEQFGGGKGKFVRFWLAREANPPSELGMPTSASNLSENVVLLFERDDYFTVCVGMATDNPRVVRLRKSLVNAVQIIPPPTPIKPCWKQVPQEHP